jgi:hypothetical protein
MNESYSGPALRLGGGGLFPVHENIQLTATGMVTVGSFTRYERNTNCVGIAGPDVDKQRRDVKETATHMQLFLGVGIDVLFGG